MHNEPVRRRRRGVGIILATLIASVMAPASPARATGADVSAGCQAAIDGALDQSFWAGTTALGFSTGETLVVEGTSFFLSGQAVLFVDGVEVTRSAITNGEFSISYVFPADTTALVRWATLSGSSNRVTWDLDCAPPVNDTDGDGVDDPDDLCPGTVDDTPTRHLKPNRFAASISDGGLVDGSGNLGFTFSQTGGCSGQQIIEAVGLGLGHEKFGLSTGAVDDWVASLS